MFFQNYFYLMIEGSGSGRPKNIWILRICIRNTESNNLIIKKKNFRKVRDLSPSKRKAEMEKIQVSNGSFFEIQRLPEQYSTVLTSTCLQDVKYI
jgi:hypothetical protein